MFSKSLRSFKQIMDHNKNELPRVTAVIVSAGKSERMGMEISKQFIPLCDIPVIARSISAFQASGMVSKIVIVTRQEDIMEVADIVHEFGFDKVARIVKGGQTRQQSAAAGLKAADDCEYIAVHDGARPLITPQCIDRVIQTAIETHAAAAAVKLKDTLKKADENGNISATVDRSSLWLVQTPQAFETGLYRDALEKAEESGEDYTDDCQLIEMAGSPVRLVVGEYTNIKLRTKEDILIAESIVRARGDAF